MDIDVDLCCINHCEHESCVLGQIELDCPLCKGCITTCDNWFEITDYGNQPKTVEFTCYNCKETFSVTNKEYWVYETND